MSAPVAVARDERTLAVENASYRVSGLVVSFGLLMDVAYRSFALGQSNWDLFALVILGGLVATVYQGVNKVLMRRQAMAAALTILAAAVVAAVVVLLRAR